jgi:Flp pilus assembly protein TadB
MGSDADGLTPKQKLMLALPLVAAAVIVLVYFGLFANPLVIAAIFVLYVAVSLWNRRKFRRQEERGEAKGRSR